MVKKKKHFGESPVAGLGAIPSARPIDADGEDRRAEAQSSAEDSEGEAAAERERRRRASRAALEMLERNLNRIYNPPF